MRPRDSTMQRRDFVRLGSLGALGIRLAGAPPPAGRSSILIWQNGGCSHLDTFDMKPDAPREIRGEFQSIPTNVPGIRICEHLPRTARLADKFTILRSMCSGESNHERAAHYLQTGQPLKVGQAPGLPGPLSAREAYGDTVMGRGCLLARRMVEAGARFVSVGGSRPGWDTHTDNFRRLKDHLLPEFDRAFATLIADLDQRGLLSTTLVIALGEFGRTPRINRDGGRDHHPGAWSVVLAGAGVPGGRVLGATDRTGTEVTDLPVAPEDLLRTVHAILRTDASGTELAAGGRLVRELLA